MYDYFKELREKKKLNKKIGRWFIWSLLKYRGKIRKFVGKFKDKVKKLKRWELVL